MPEPYVGEIRLFAGASAPAGWAICDGSTLPIAEYTLLFTVIGATYGGDGASDFALPDLRGRTPVHQGVGRPSTYTLGQVGGVEQAPLLAAHLPSHAHTVTATSTGLQLDPAGTRPSVAGAGGDGLLLYSTTRPATPFHPSTIGPGGGGAAHENRQPFVGVNFIIATLGLPPV